MKIMKTNKLLFLLTIISTFMLTNCVKDEDLEQYDPNVETADTFWENAEDAQKGVNAIYGSLITDGSYMRSTPLLLDLRGDGARSHSPWAAMANVGKFNSDVTDAAIYGWAFETYYQGVFRANQALENIPNIEMDQVYKNRLLGQAYFLRGLYFFHLVNMFNSVPLPLTSVEIYHEQKSHAEGWAQVKSDFQAAADLLPVSYDGVDGPDVGEKGRATKGAALAYLGKAQLFTQEFSNAKATFEDVMNLNVYSLVANYRDNFTTENENNSESIFEVQFTRDGDVDLGWGGTPLAPWGQTSARAITYGPRGFGFVDVQPTWALFNDFHLEQTVDGETDPRLEATMFYNSPNGMTLYGQDFATYYAGSPADLNDLFCRKYQNSDGQFADEFDWRSGINERIMRYADVLLMYAECLNETGNTTLAYDYIQMVRDRVNLPDLSVTQPGMSQQEMRDQIAHERFLEFGFEGHRFDDIRRWGWLEDPVKLQWLIDRDSEIEGYLTTGGLRDFFPIPQSEMDNNPLVTQQNTGY